MLKIWAEGRHDPIYAAEADINVDGRQQMRTMMTLKITLLTVGATMLLATAASAQNVREDYSYKAPSGQFGDGTGAWQNYRFQAMDAERMQELRNGVTGSIPRTDQGSGISTDTVWQPSQG